MRFKINYSWLLLLVPLAFICWYVAAAMKKEPLRQLPFFGPKGSAVSEERPHIIGSFAFTAHDGNSFSEKDVDGKIYVAEFFFTTCQTICPVMNSQLKRVYRHFAGEPRVLLLSHTVDPDTDSAAVLSQYAGQMGVNDARWKFVTGSKKDLYHMARKSYLLDDGSGKGDENDFVHTQNFALVDWKRRVRGFYDGTDSAEVSRLITDIETLLRSYDYESARH